VTSADNPRGDERTKPAPDAQGERGATLGPSSPFARPWHRLHASSVAVLLLAAAVLIALDFSCFVGVDPLQRRVLRYGWPAACLSLPAAANPPAPGDGRPPAIWSYGALLFDLALAAALLTLATAAAEQRRRRWRHLLQFSLAELLIFVLVLGGVCGWAFHDYRRQQAALDRLADLEQGVGVDQSLPEWMWRQLPYLPGGRLKPLDKVASIALANSASGETPRLDALRELVHLKRLEFRNELGGESGGVGAETGDDDLRLVGHLRGLVKLRICGDRVSDAGLASLTRLTGLKELELSCPNVGEAGLAQLKGLEQLQRLQIWRCRLTPAALDRLARLPRLESLDLGLQGPVSGQLLASLRNLSALRSLKLSGLEVADAEVAELDKLEQLEHLSLFQTKVSGAAFVRLQTLPRLQSLSVAVSPITDDSLAALAEFRRLKYLTLLFTRVTDAGVARLAVLERLERLEINESASYNVEGLGVSRRGVDQLRILLPACEIAFHELKAP